MSYRKVYNNRVDEVCDEVIAAIKLKLKIRTKIGLYELIETFKHFTEEGKDTITFPQMRMVFEMMGFSFSENQVRPLSLRCLCVGAALLHAGPRPPQP
jgi:hypothetical protein